MQTILKINNLRKNYGKKEVLKDINLNVYQGENIAILGANGSGKTTLVEIICQTKTASGGEIHYHFSNDKIKENIGIQFQDGDWPDGLSAKDILEFYKALYPHVSEEETFALIKAFDLTEFFSRPLNRLSGGQRQRFNALLAVFHKPELIILDEVSTGLDIQLRHNILKFLKNMTQDHQKTIMLISHNPDEVEFLCDRLVILHEGKIYFDAKIKDVIDKYQGVAKLMDLYFEGGLK
ncbi:ABC transporter ATP-binding protein [Spiroplasma eriocheiris]|uniref:ABC transporter ATP-binding protein n=1 Tax=Spiroplasma eriocheiris TaxID=315358 RepID=A0A0H3XIM0_9MOLU|nr:ABC transporter ATP-binding protein [Spiroplasma eriocheiris]AHF57882.1 putative ABC-type multidrug transport system ATP-binding protein [Spiroplasma eriocheiris CCTCC M 207170]AKM54325.1 ABC transporter ATP-binding protein [Spiroplasma eriocheiris]